MNKNHTRISKRRMIFIVAAVVIFDVSLALYLVFSNTFGIGNLFGQKESPPTDRQEVRTQKTSTQETDKLKGAPSPNLSNSGVAVLDDPLAGVEEFTQQKIYCNILAARVKDSLNSQHLKFEGGIEMCLTQDGKVLGVELHPRGLDTNSSKLILSNLRSLKFPALKVDAFGLARNYAFEIHGNSISCELLQAPVEKKR